MIQFTMKEAKRNFFRADAIMRPVERATQQALARYGAFVRTTAKQSIKRPRRANVGRDARGKFTSSGFQVSTPGQPPYSKTRLLPRTIFFIYEPNRRTVVIGPVKLNKPSLDALEMLEFGGVTTRQVTTPSGAKQTRPARYRARPFMGPAQAKELPQLPHIWAMFINKAM